MQSPSSPSKSFTIFERKVNHPEVVTEEVEIVDNRYNDMSSHTVPDATVDSSLNEFRLSLDGSERTASICSNPNDGQLDVDRFVKKIFIKSPDRAQNEKLKRKARKQPKRNTKTDLGSSRKSAGRIPAVVRLQKDNMHSRSATSNFPTVQNNPGRRSASTKSEQTVNNARRSARSISRKQITNVFSGDEGSMKMADSDNYSTADESDKTVEVIDITGT